MTTNYNPDYSFMPIDPRPWIDRQPDVTVAERAVYDVLDNNDVIWLHISPPMALDLARKIINVLSVTR